MYASFLKWFEWYSQEIKPLMEKGYSYEAAKFKVFNDFNKRFHGIGII